MECGRVLALLQGRLHLSVDDIQTVAPSVLRHRIMLNFSAEAEGVTSVTVIDRLLSPEK